MLQEPHWAQIRLFLPLLPAVWGCKRETQIYFLPYRVSWEFSLHLFPAKPLHGRSWRAW